MSRHAGAYEYAKDSYIIGNIPDDATPCVECGGSGLSFEDDDTCWCCFGSGVDDTQTSKRIA